MDDELKKLLETMRQENSAAHQETRTHVARIDAKIDSTAERLDAKIDSTAASLGGKIERLDAKIDSTADNLRRHFDVTIEGTNSSIRLVAESVAQLTEEVRRGFSSLDTKIDTTTAETRAMIKFSHADLDRQSPR